MSMRDSFGCTPQQYHAGLDKLWEALPGDPEDWAGESIFEKAAAALRTVAPLNERLLGWQGVCPHPAARIERRLITDELQCGDCLKTPIQVGP